MKKLTKLLHLTFIAASSVGFSGKASAAETGSLAATSLKGHDKWVTYGIVVDQNLAITTSWDKSVMLHNLATETHEKVTDMNAQVSLAKYHKTAGLLAAADWDGWCKLLTFPSKEKPQLTFRHADKRINWVDFSPDGKRIVTASDTGSIAIWSTIDGTQLLSLPLAINEQAGHKEFVKSAIYNREGNRIVSASFDGSVKIWNAKSGELMQTLKHDPRLVTGNPKINPDGLRAEDLDDSAVNSAVFIPGESKIASGGTNGTVWIWESVDDRWKPALVKQCHDHKRVNTVSINKDGTFLLTAGDDRKAKIWDTKSMDLLLSYEHPDIMVSANFSDDGARVIATSKDRTAVIFDVKLD